MKDNIIEQIWPPLRSEQNETAVRIDCGGRTIYMDGPLPARIASGGHEVLAAPARLRAYFDGQEKPLVTHNTYREADGAAAAEDRLVFMSQSTAGNAIFDSRVTIERDGLIWVDLMVLPTTPSGSMPCPREDVMPRLNGLVLELPIRRELAELYHYWPSVGGGLSNSGSLPGEGLSLRFRPHLWLGREEAGLSFYAESDRDWQNADPSRVLSVRMTDTAAVLCVQLLDSMPAAWVGRTADSWGCAIEPVSFSFGLQATPVKPYRPMGDFRRVCHKNLAASDPEHPYELDAFEREADELAAAGVRWRTFHEDWSMVQNYGLPQDEALFKAKVDALHRRGIKAMVYFGYEYSGCAPGFFDDYRRLVLRNADGSLRGGWQRRPPQRDYIVCYAGDYSETMLARVRRAMEEYGVDGIYTDGTYVPLACANGEHGCGWTDAQGNRHAAWPLRRVREHVRRLYEQVHMRGGIVEAHQSGCIIPMILAYADSYWDGEHVALTTDPVTGAPRALTGAELVERFTGGSGAGVGVMRAEFTGINFGIPCQFLSYASNYDECSGLTILYGTLPKAHNSLANVRAAARHWQLADEYGLTEERFRPFWRDDCPVRCTDSRVCCSAWETPDGIMAVLVNLSGEPVETGLSCRVPYAQAVEAVGGRVLAAPRVTVADAAPVYVFLKYGSL